MITAIFELEYPPGIADEVNAVIVIPLALEYGLRTTAEGYDLLLKLYAASDPFTVRDKDGYYWDFWRETVKVFSTFVTS